MSKISMNIRLHGTEFECQSMASWLASAPGVDVLAGSKPYADRGASRMVRVFVEIRLDQEPASAPSRGRSS